MFTSYKNRVIDQNRPVKVYKNLHNGLWSISQDGLVKAHASRVRLEEVTFKVSQAGRERVLKEKKKNVHAFIIGIITHEDNIFDDPKQFIVYNPYKFNKFMFKDSICVADVSPETHVVMDINKGVFTV